MLTALKLDPTCTSPIFIPAYRYYAVVTTVKESKLKFTDLKFFIPVFNLQSNSVNEVIAQYDFDDCTSDANRKFVFFTGSGLFPLYFD